VQSLVRTLLGIIGALAISWFLCRAFDRPHGEWLSWAAVFLELAGIAATALGIIKSRFGYAPGEFLRRAFNRIFRKSVRGDAEIQLKGVEMASTVGTPEVITAQDLPSRLAALEARVDRMRMALEQSMQRQLEGVREEARELAAAIDARLRARDEKEKAWLDGYSRTLRRSRSFDLC
jgi:hypothetical protein